MKHELLSVGIDVGTTTTHLVFCLLRAENTRSASQIPRQRIAGDSQILYRSPVHFTPLDQDGNIDAVAVYQMIEAEYRKASIEPETVSCGAAIITGESAARRNAAALIAELSRLAGDFVAASAGAELESILAARGSGASSYSRRAGCRVRNIDIGGGTTNAATFLAGELENVWYLDYGGRFIRFDEDGVVASVSASAERLFKELGIEINCGEKPRECLLVESANAVAVAILDACLDSDADQAQPQYWFSGGVAELIEKSEKNKLVYRDMGVFLADALHRELERRGISYKIADQAIRATVIGAGAEIVQLSGHTVFVDEALLPLKNLPLLRVPQGPSLSSLLKELHGKYRNQFDDGPVALLLPDLPLHSYKALCAAAEEILCFIEEVGPMAPHVFVTRSDSAMALGQQIRKRSSDLPLLVLDGIDLLKGDYLEIGRALSGGLTLPVIVKTLVFPEQIMPASRRKEEKSDGR
ncbi:MAG: ethanolamine ammonia-lyase reactivating factor EutA [Candidatus Obscuribacterales bacterium]|nr:ethanolamine ammonia-lyase reactivating factor EutA [Candidatus Obscuribacterales bacterium]